MSWNSPQGHTRTSSAVCASMASVVPDVADVDVLGERQRLEIVPGERSPGGTSLVANEPATDHRRSTERYLDGTFRVAEELSVRTVGVGSRTASESADGDRARRCGMDAAMEKVASSPQ